MNADGPVPKVLLADKAYDADFFREDMERRGGTAMIPTKRNRLIQSPVRDLCPAQHGRTLLQQAQEWSTARNPLR